MHSLLFYCAEPTAVRRSSRPRVTVTRLVDDPRPRSEAPASMKTGARKKRKPQGATSKPMVSSMLRDFSFIFSCIYPSMLLKSCFINPLYFSCVFILSSSCLHLPLIIKLRTFIHFFLSRRRLTRRRCRRCRSGLRPLLRPLPLWSPNLWRRGLRQTQLDQRLKAQW